MSTVAGDTLTIEIILTDPAGEPITSASDGDFTETIRHVAANGTRTPVTPSAWQHDANGLYYATIANAQAGRYTGLVTYAGTPVQTFAIDEPVISAVQADPLSRSLSGYAADTAGNRLARIGTSVVQVAAPVAATGDLRLTAGDDYASADSRQLDWTVPLTQLNLTGSTVTCEIRAGAVTLTKTATIVNAGQTTQTARVALTDTETASLATMSRVGRYRLTAVTSGGNRVTLAAGKVYVLMESA